MTKTSKISPKSSKKTAKRSPSAEDIYCIHIPEHYMDASEFPEDAEIKNTVLSVLEYSGFKKRNLKEGELDGLCKSYGGLNQLLEMQTNTMVLYIKNRRKVKSAASIILSYDEYDEQIMVDEIKIYTLCSREKGYGKKLLEKIKILGYVGNDNEFITDDANIVLNYTESSRAFYEKLGFECRDDDMCYFGVGQ